MSINPLDVLIQYVLMKFSRRDLDKHFMEVYTQVLMDKSGKGINE